MNTRIIFLPVLIFMVIGFNVHVHGQRPFINASIFYTGCRSFGKVVLHPVDTLRKLRYLMVSSGCDFPLRPMQDSPVFDRLPPCTYTFQAFDENNQASETVRVKVGLQVEPNFYLSCGQEKGLYFVNLKIFNNYNHLTGQYYLEQSNSAILNISQEGRSAYFFSLSDTTSNVQVEFQNDPAKQTIIYIRDGCGDFDSTLYHGDLLQPLKITLTKTCEGKYIFNNNLARFGISKYTFSGNLSFLWYVNNRLILDSTAMILNSFSPADRVRLRLSGLGCELDVTEFSMIDTAAVPFLLSTSSDSGSICTKKNTWLRISQHQVPRGIVHWNTGETGDSILVADVGRYTAIGINQFGCRDTLEWMINPSTIAITSSTEDNLCFGQSNGKISIEPKGPAKPYQYEWEDRSNKNFRESLVAGNYNVTVVDADACRVVYSYQIKSPPVLNLSVITSNSSCNIRPNGSAQSLIEGGSAPYAFNWSNGLTADKLDGLSPGKYQVVAKDKNQCLDSVSFEINSEIRTYRFFDTICFGASFQIGKSLYSQTGTYLDTLKSSGGCDSIVQTNLNVSAPLQIEILNSDPRCYGGMDGQINIKPVNGHPGFKYYLNNKISTHPNFTDLSAGQYKIKVEDRIGCISESQVNLIQPQQDELSLGRDTILEYGDSLHVKLLGDFVNGSITGIKWETDPGQGSCTNCFSTYHYLPTENHRLKALVTTIRGCKVEATMNIRIRKNFKVYTPNIFHPDGLNSENRYFTIYGNKQLLKINYLRVFNRTGSLVFEVENSSPNQPEVGWDGRFRGQNAETGVYVYLAELLYADQSTEIIKGDIMLIR